MKIRVIIDLDSERHGDLARVMVDLNDILKENPNVSKKLDISLLRDRRDKPSEISDNRSDSDEFENISDPSGGIVPGVSPGGQVDKHQGHRPGDKKGSGGDPDDRDDPETVKEYRKIHLSQSGRKR